MWMFPNINLLAPIFKKMWGNVFEEILACKKMVKQGTPLIKIIEIFFTTFALSILDHKKCSITLRMTIRTRQNMVTSLNRDR
jgi:hypothetical protein